MFESFRQGLEDLMDRATPPEERRAGLARMKDTLVHAKMGVEDLRGGVATTRQKLDAEEREVATMRRRREAASAINDSETVALAEKYEKHHGERVEILRRKLDAQVEELTLVEREVEEMTAELKRAVTGGGATSARASIDDDARKEVESTLDSHEGLGSEIDAIARAGQRADREAAAERQLAELKKRMGK